MPISRKKACSSCRESKARCNLDLPCSRCAERGFSCSYEKAPVFRRPYPSPRALASRSPHSQSQDTAGRMPTPAVWDPSLAEELLDPQVPEFPWTTSETDPWFDNLDCIPTPVGRPINTSSQPMCSPDQDSALSMLAPIGMLSQRKPANAEKYLTSKVIFGQVTSYPRMMVDGRGRLPPFIYPQCVLDGKPVEECRADGNGNHSCLSEILAICASQLHMFFTRTAASSDYVWKTICDYSRQLHQNCPSFNAHQLVEVLQVTVMYLLTQALDVQSIGKNDMVHSLVSTTREAGQRLHALHFYQGSGSPCSPGSLSRKGWVAQESARRSIGILYAIEAVFDVDVASRRQHCQGYDQVPLPSPRDLWEPVDNATWAARYQASLNNHHAMRGTKRYLVFEDLRQLNGRVAVSGGVEASDPTDAANFQAIEHWCETIDEFGTLIWMSVMVQSRS
ncbi:hypothetical protein B0H67DRAFT_583049 [Lasiosphaeris hirsuta]|uniref:Zn(2)-C6 fungal-type domain-containing protein n=1 Tax=Lasiosphaeris hirsuta TaxID=260670 RepID=A0AA40A784_9PEZI|nr:hypothetical protein B0H67DRAFT_583049 [Lasiosphaeris hirsuta]